MENLSGSGRVVLWYAEIEQGTSRLRLQEEPWAKRTTLRRSRKTLGRRKCARSIPLVASPSRQVARNRSGGKGNARNSLGSLQRSIGSSEQTPSSLLRTAQETRKRKRRRQDIAMRKAWSHHCRRSCHLCRLGRSHQANHSIARGLEEARICRSQGECCAIHSFPCQVRRILLWKSCFLQENEGRNGC